MKIVVYSLFLANFFLISSCVQGQSNPKETREVVLNNESVPEAFPILDRMNEKAALLKPYLKHHLVYNQKIAILIDMRQHSGKKRLYVYDMDSMKIISKGLVAHGSGSETVYEYILKFSNVPNSYTSSLGKYKIGSAYTGSFGRSYKLHGLETTNNKAYERAVVLHRYSCVPDNEQEYEICNSLGCPMVSENYFLEIDKYISSSTKPIILEIFSLVSH